MKIISITGGVGSGKSEVLRVLQEEFDAEIIKADEVAHQLMEPGKKGYQHVVEALGDSFLNKDGSIDRKKLAALIFQNKEAVETNERHHPPDGSGRRSAMRSTILTRRSSLWRQLSMMTSTMRCLMKSGMYTHRWRTASNV